MDELPIPLEQLGPFAPIAIFIIFTVWTIRQFNTHILPCLARARYLPTAINRVFKHWFRRELAEQLADQIEALRADLTKQISDHMEALKSEVTPNGGDTDRLGDTVKRIADNLVEVHVGLRQLNRLAGDVQILRHEKTDHDLVHDRLQEERENEERSVAQFVRHYTRWPANGAQPPGGET